MTETTGDGSPHRHEPHSGSLAARLNWLRAGVLGANDGIISTAGLVIGVAAATTNSSAIATAGVAGLVAGAVSMALGEYISVSTQRDTERALIAKEGTELQQTPDVELEELIGLLRKRGLTSATSRTVADELTAHDPLEAHLALELGISREDLAQPWAAAGSSAIAFTIGALVPLIAIIFPPPSARIPVAFVAVLIALASTGALSAHLGGSRKAPAMARLVIGGALAMLVTYGVGALMNVAVT
ncbi:MAG TPA: VIT family protein [Ilumatobacteraceae bacterium]|nr:VIT family protein [Ilumatobacteraceae bacterium]